MYRNINKIWDLRSRICIYNSGVYPETVRATKSHKMQIST